MCLARSCSSLVPSAVPPGSSSSALCGPVPGRRSVLPVSVGAVRAAAPAGPGGRGGRLGSASPGWLCSSAPGLRPVRWWFPVVSRSALGAQVVGFCGSRSLGPGFADLVRRTVSAALGAGSSLAVGCAAGADQLVLSAALAALPGRPWGRLSVFAVGGVRGGWLSSSPATWVSGPPPWVAAAAAAGAQVSWWAGGSIRLPLRARLARRSAALVRSLPAAPGSALVAFVSRPCPARVAPGRGWPGGGSGSWASLAMAAGLGVPVRLFWCGSGAPALPSWPGWSWSLVSSGPLSGSWAPVRVVVQPALF